MTHLSIRLRLTLWHTATLALILLAFATATYLYVRTSLFNQIEERLTEDLAAIEQTLRDSVDTLVELEAHNVVGVFRVAESGWPLYRTGHWVLSDLETAPQDVRWPAVRIWTSPRRGLFHLTHKTLETPHGRFEIGWAREAEQIHRSLDRLAIALLTAVPLLMLASLIGGHWLAGKTLAPVATLTQRAREISAERLGERLPNANPYDELGQLTAVLNDGFSRLEAAFTQLKRFTQDAAHELRTPLAVLRSVGEVGLQERRDADSYREIIGSMLEEVDRLGQLVDGLLTLARAESGRVALQRQPEDLRALCQDVVDCLRVLAEDKHQTLVLHADLSLTATVDRGTLRLALINLVANAIRFTPASGAINVQLTKDGGSVRIEVQDSGPGIAPAHHARLFDRFYRVDPARAQESGGTGLGLAIARWAVEANGGRIELDSAPGRGSTFRVVLPHV